MGCITHQHKEKLFKSLQKITFLTMKRDFLVLLSPNYFFLLIT